MNINIDLTTWQVIGLILDYTIKIIAVGVVPEGRRPSSSNAWLLLILLLPVVGLPLFLLMGSPYIDRRRHRIQQEANQKIENVHEGFPDRPDDTTLSPEVDSMVRLSRELTGFPAVHANYRGLHSDYNETIARIAEVIDEARDYVHVEIYIQAWDETTDVFYRSLERAVKRGVRVRLLLDQIGSLKYPGFRKLGRRLSEIGVEWELMLPLAPWRGRWRRPDLRNHRKVIVIDGDIAFIGSMNMIDRTYLIKKHTKKQRMWIDAMAEVSGPIVASIESMFAVDWYTESDEAIDVPAPHEVAGETGEDNVVQLVPSGPGYTTEPNLRMFTSLIHHAKERLVICSPYFIPNESMLEAVTTACYRGVQVDLLVSEKADQFFVHHAQSSYYQVLLEAGVNIHQYPFPYVLHTKFVLADPAAPDDRSVAAFGSSNLDMRSFGLNYESTLLVATGNLLTQIHELGESYISASSKLTLDEWNERGWGRRYLDNVCKLTSALQ
ncbi:cardiolipin synthase [Corynebacterium tapiri]|uniref:Cardiolipin synthase n=1 Tax=Corynebacterium tapiri TaxID=1448266 RepID=A0A5C4U1X4_9CORY|nr:cardiolipin synthase [Corynebacterium tapiri]TNL95752.1 cardiolipin synthase [Corynebacterium tapiri]